MTHTHLNGNLEDVSLSVCRECEKLLNQLFTEDGLKGS